MKVSPPSEMTDEVSTETPMNESSDDESSSDSEFSTEIEVGSDDFNDPDSQSDENEIE